MSYTYHGTSELVALPGENQRVVNGNFIIIEKDYAVRADKISDVLEKLAPGSKMPGTEYRIDLPPNIQFNEDGFARIRLSGSFGDFAEAAPTQNFQPIEISLSTYNSTDENLTNIANADVTLALYRGNFTFFRSKYSNQSGEFVPNFPAIISPINVKGTGFLNDTLFPDAYNQNVSVALEGTKWVAYETNSTEVYEGRATQYDITAICAPEFIRISIGALAFIEFYLTNPVGVAATAPTTKYIAAGKIGYVLSRYYGDAFGISAYLLDYVREYGQVSSVQTTPFYGGAQNGLLDSITRNWANIIKQ